jgi:hypothetical protein
MRNVERRIQRAVESILEDPQLTADLDDAAAKLLIDWGVDCATMVARGTADLGEAEAAEAVSERLRAVRLLMREVNRWMGRDAGIDAEGQAKYLSKVLEHVETIYGDRFVPPDEIHLGMFQRQDFSMSPEPGWTIQQLRAFVDRLTDEADLDRVDHQ